MVAKSVLVASRNRSGVSHTGEVGEARENNYRVVFCEGVKKRHDLAIAVGRAF